MTITCRLQPQEKKYRSMPDIFLVLLIFHISQHLLQTRRHEYEYKLKSCFGVTSTEAVVVGSASNYAHVGSQITSSWF